MSSRYPHIGRFLALFLTLSIGLGPSSAHALRIQQSPVVRSGLEETLTPNRNGDAEHWLRQLLPAERWEAGQSRVWTSGYPRELKKVDPATWSEAPAVRTAEAVVVQGRSVMESWQQPYMAEFARVVTRNGGRILELGFGMGLAANAIEQYDIEEHVIIEPNHDIYEMAVQFSKRAPHKVTVLHGRWQDLVEDRTVLPDASFDGVFFDASPFDERELHFRQFDFAEHAQRLLRPGGVYTYCNLTSLGRVKDFYDSWGDLFRETQLPNLRQRGFEDASFEVVSVQPFPNHPKYQHQTALVPILRKPTAGLEERGFSSGEIFLRASRELVQLMDRWDRLTLF